MRTILFRGKAKEAHGMLPAGSWVAGGYYCDDGCQSNPLRFKYYILTWNSMGPGGFMDRIEVDPMTIGQFTGLYDNDGGLIFEGDVLDGSYINPMSEALIKRHYEVAFDKGCFYAKLIGHHPYGTTQLYFENQKSTIIGNIHDNSELLESEQTQNREEQS